MSLGPFFRSPFTDLTGCLVNHQDNGKCADMEMRMVDCLEAYGTERGLQKCYDLITDFQECASMQKQIDRYHAMRIERHRQYLMGEREKKDHYATPPRTDAY